MAISFKGAHFPPEVILMGVRWYVAYPLSTRHVEALMEERGGGGSLHDQPVDHQVQPAAGGGMPSAQASRVGELAHGNVPDATCKNALVPPQALCVDAGPPEGWSQKGAGNAHPLLLP